MNLLFLMQAKLETGLVAFRDLCDVTLSLSLNPVPVREDYTPEHTHTFPSELQSDSPRSHTARTSRIYSVEGMGVEDEQQRKGSI